MVRIRGRKLSRNVRRWSGEGGPREGGRGRHRFATSGVVKVGWGTGV